MLSQLVSQVWDVGKTLQAGFEDIQAYDAPSECNDLVVQGAKRQLQAIFKAAQMSPETFLEEVEARTSPRWVFFSGLGGIVSLAMEPN